MADIEKDLDALREATRVAHEATKDLKAAIKEARSVIAEIKAEAEIQVSERLEAAVKSGLAELDSSIEKAIEDSTDRVYARFDKIADILTGETKKDKQKGEPSMADLAKQVVDKRNGE